MTARLFVQLTRPPSALTPFPGEGGADENHLSEEVDGPEFVLGRELLLRFGLAPDPTVSRRHAAITRTGEQFHLVDLGSRNGTLHNGARLQAKDGPVPLSPGDVVALGAHTFRLVAEPDTEPQAADAARVFAETTLAAAGAGASDRLRLVYDLSRLTLADTPQAELAVRFVALLRRALPDVRLGVWLAGTEAPAAGSAEVRPFAQSLIERRVLGEGLLLTNPAGRRPTAVALPLAPLPEPAGHLVLTTPPTAPLAPEDLDFVVASAALFGEALRRGRRTARLALPDDPGEIVGQSDGIAACRREVDLVAPYAEVSVLLVGETGVGKELFARRVHDRSGRAGPLVPVNMAAIPAELMESELFGHVKGAFTGAIGAKTGFFEYAAGGTLFLDEIGEMPTPLQAKLLRVLESRKMSRVGDPRPVDVDVRIVAATNIDFAARVESGAFRRDLYYRLAGKEVRIPPLRERPGDVRLLAELFRRRTSRPGGPTAAGFGDEALALLERAPWPGNVRQLESTVRLAVIHAASEGAVRVQPEHLDPRILETARSAPATLAEELEAAERAVVLKAMRLAKGNKREAARLLDWSINTLRDRLVRWGIAGPERD